METEAELMLPIILENGINKYFSGLENLSTFQQRFVVVTITLFLIASLYIIHSFRPKSLKRIVKKSENIPIDEFLELRNKKKGRKLASEKCNVPGVYILHNHTKHMYYVGQAYKIISRVNSHFTGKGNGRVYADYVQGDRFTVRFVTLKKSKEKNLNDLERKYILKYRANETGYNRTKGNVSK